MRKVDHEIENLETGSVAKRRGQRKKGGSKDRIKRREMAQSGKNVALAKNIFADLGIAIGEMEDSVAKPYVDDFLIINEMYETLTDTDEFIGIRLRNRIASLMEEIEVNGDFYFNYKITTFRIGGNTTYKVNYK